MNYEKIYQDFYLKYYSEIEILIKKKLIKEHSEKRTFNYSINKVIDYLNNDFCNQYISYKNEKLYKIFCKRYSLYSFDAIQEVFKNEIKVEYDKINILELPENYNYSEFIKDIALIEVENEISRLLSKNYTLLDMFYKLDNFDEFEIKNYNGLYLEDTPVFAKLHLKLHPEYYEDVIEKKVSDINLLSKSANDNAIRFFDYLIENYRTDESTKVKYVNILHYLKNDSNKELFVFDVKQSDFKEIVKLKVNITINKFSKSERYYEVEKPIFNSLERRFAKEKV